MADADWPDRLAQACLWGTARPRGYHTLQQALDDPLLAGLLWRVFRDDLAALWPDRDALDQAMQHLQSSPLPFPDSSDSAVLRAYAGADRPVLALLLAQGDMDDSALAALLMGQVHA